MKHSQVRPSTTHHMSGRNEHGLWIRSIHCTCVHALLLEIPLNLCCLRLTIGFWANVIPPPCVTEFSINKRRQVQGFVTIPQLTHWVLSYTFISEFPALLIHACTLYMLQHILLLSSKCHNYIFIGKQRFGWWRLNKRILNSGTTLA